MESMNFQEIYAQLLDGKRLTLLFKSPESAENFRVKMAKYKTAQEDLCEIVDLKIGSEKKKLSFYLDMKDRYIISFAERPSETHYEVLEIENT